MSAAGKEWLKEAERDAERMSREDAQDSKSFGHYLLESLGRIIAEQREARAYAPGERFFLRTLDLLTELNQDDEAPWKKKPKDELTAHRLGSVLNDYGVKPAQVREGHDRSRGYWSDDLEKVIGKYV